MPGIPAVLAKLDVVLEEIEALQAALAEPKSVQKICAHCGGDGDKGTGNGDIPCPDCGSDGVMPFGRITLTSEE